MPDRRGASGRLPVALIAVGAAVGLLGLAGLVLGWGSHPTRVAGAPSAPPRAGATTAPSAAVAPPAAPATTPTVTPNPPTIPTTTGVGAPPEAPEQFLAAFVTAIRTDDVGFLFDRMAPAVLARYGPAQCRSEAARLADPTAALRLVSVSGPATYAWTTGTRTTDIPDTYTFEVQGTVHGVPGSTRLYHLPFLDGRFRILADCGTPLPPG